MNSPIGATFTGVLLALLAWDWISYLVTVHVLNEGLQHAGWWRLGTLAAVALVLLVIVPDIRSRWVDAD